MASFSKLTRNSTILLLTSLGIVAFLLFYIFSYIPENEERINARNYRVLQRVGGNMSNSVINFSRYVGNSFVSDAIKKTVIQVPSKTTTDSIDETTLLRYLKNAHQQGTLTAKLGLQFYFDEKDNDRSHPPEDEQLFHYLDEKGQLYLHFSSSINTQTNTELTGRGILLTQEAKAARYHIKVPLDSLLNSLMRRDTFKHLIVLAPDKTLPIPSTSNKEKPAPPAFKVIYNSRETADLVPLDTLARLANYASSGRPANVNIAGIPHKLFTLTQRVGPNERWYLYGTLPTQKYQTESRAIPAHVVSFCALAVAILLMAFPFLKLLLMSRQERLFRQDLIFSFLSLFCGVALVVLLLFDVYAYYGADRYAEKKRLELLAGNLQQNLKDEIKLLIGQIGYFDNIAGDTNTLMLPPNTYWASLTDNQLKRTNDQYFPYFQRVFWVDNNGLMSSSWADPKENNARTKVGYREYYKKIKNGGGYTLDNTGKFVLESVTSNTDGEKYAVISMASNRPEKDKFTVVALATKLTSLSRAILPLGYGFCLIDKEGKVLFHQNENLNQNENLLEETDANPYLKAALYGQVPVHFTHIYQGNPQQFFISPVAGLPFYLVTFVNDSYHKAFNVNLLVLTAMFISLYLFSIAILTTFIIYLNDGFADKSFSWLWPKKNIGHAYFKVILALSLITLLTLLLTNIEYQVSTYFIYVLAAVYAFIYIYSQLNQVSFANTLKQSRVVMLAFNGLCLFVAPSTFLTSALYQVIVIFLLRQLDKQAQTQTLNQNSAFFEYLENALPSKRSYHHLYAGMLTIWFILASGLPAFVLFRVAYNYEAELMVRFNQVNLAQIAQAIKPADINQANLPQEEKWATTTASYYTNFFYHTNFEAKSDAEPNNSKNAISRHTNAPYRLNHKLPKESSLSINVFISSLLGQTPGQNNETTLLNNFIPLFRPIFRNVLSDEYFLKDNKLLNWQLTDKDPLQFDLFNPQAGVQLSSHMPEFQVPFIFYRHTPANNLTELVNKSGLFFWIDIILLICLLYVLISFLITRTFNIDIIAKIQKSHGEPDVLNLKNKNNLFLISLPHAPDIRAAIQEENNSYNCYFTQFDLAVTGTTLDPTATLKKLESTLQEINRKTRKDKFLQALKLRKKPLTNFLIIQHFDYDPFTKPSLDLKIQVLHRLSALPHLKIILQSTISPWSWEEQLKTEELKREKGTADADYLLLLQQLLMHLNAYTKTYQPLQTLSETPIINSAPENSKEALLAVIEAECAAATYLEQHFKSLMVNFVQENHATVILEKTDIIMRLQSLAQLYYRSLWHTCTEEEKYFLYDMAQDGLVNAKNVPVLSSLLGKGLLVTDQSGLLKIMNQSFRHFIQTVVNRADALRFEKKYAQGSQWSMYKAPLVLILLGAVLFFFFTQKTSWANIIAVLTAVSSIAAILPRLSILVPSFLLSKDSKAAD